MRHSAFLSLCIASFTVPCQAQTLRFDSVLRGTYEIISEVETVWQLPNGGVAGVLFVAHGCQHSATDFWPHSDSCPTCVGLPEEKRIVDAVLSAKWAVVAMSSADRVFSRCWDVDADGLRIANALRSFQQQHRLTDVPLAAFGASSGGAFALQLPQLLPLHAVVSQIMALTPSMLVSRSGAFPPTLFLHMPRDRRTQLLVRRSIKKLKDAGTAAAEVEMSPLPIDSGFFARRIQGVSSALSAKLQQLLLTAGLLNTHDFTLVEDPRSSNWRDAVRKDPDVAAALPGPRGGTPDSLEADVSAMAEEMNVAWAVHEISADHMPVVIKWIQLRGAVELERAPTSPAPAAMKGTELLR